MKKFEYCEAYVILKHHQARAMREAESWRLAKQALGQRPNLAIHILNLFNNYFRLPSVRREKGLESKQPQKARSSRVW